MMGMTSPVRMAFSPQPELSGYAQTQRTSNAASYADTRRGGRPCGLAKSDLFGRQAEHQEDQPDHADEHDDAEDQHFAALGQGSYSLLACGHRAFLYRRGAS